MFEEVEDMSFRSCFLKFCAETGYSIPFCVIYNFTFSTTCRIHFFFSLYFRDQDGIDDHGIKVKLKRWAVPQPTALGLTSNV